MGPHPGSLGMEHKPLHVPTTLEKSVLRQGCAKTARGEGITLSSSPHALASAGAFMLRGGPGTLSLAQSHLLLC